MVGVLLPVNLRQNDKGQRDTVYIRSVASGISASNFSPYAIAQKKAACSSGFSESTAEKLARASPAKWDYFDAEW